MSRRSNFNVAQHIFDSNRGWPDKIAFIDDQECVNYHDLEQRAQSLCQAFSSIGSGRTLKIMISVVDSIDCGIMKLAGLLGGHTVIMCNANATSALVADYINICHPDVICCNDASQELILKLSKNQDYLAAHIISVTQARNMWHCERSLSEHHQSADSGALWVFSSGSGGRSRIVMHDHHTVYAAGISMMQVAGINQQDTVYATAKLNFTLGSSCSFYCVLLSGATGILRKNMPTAATVVSTIRLYRPTVFVAIPKMYNLILNSDLDIANMSMKICISAGEPLPTSIDITWHHRTGTEIYDMYGLTEMHAMILANRPGDKKLGSSGKSVSGTKCVLRNEQGKLCADGELGQLFVSGPSKSLGYHDDQATTDIIFQGDWVATGDRFLRDSDGFYRFIGRVNDMFKVDAQWVSPIEVENILLQDELVIEAGVTCRKNLHGLAEVGAVIVPKASQPLPANFQHRLLRLVQKNLEPHKAPKSIRISDELPRNPNGKLLRHLL